MAIRKSSIKAKRENEKEKVSDWERTLMTFPFIEAVLGAVFGLLFYFILNNKTLAELSWLLGPALSISRKSLLTSMKEEFDSLHNLSRHVDFAQSGANESIKKLDQLYAQIVEPDFREIKDGIISDAEKRLGDLAYKKRSDELNTGEYFNWLFKFLENTRPGSTIWAISMNLEIEWNESQEEDTFLRLNLDAAERKVTVERIFVVKESELEKFVENKYVRKQIDSSGEYMKPTYVTKEHLEKVDSKLLKSLGEGIIAVDKQVVLIDIESEEGYRGIVTMNSTEIDDWYRRFNQLKIYASEFKGENLMATENQIANQISVQ